MHQLLLCFQKFFCICDSQEESCLLSVCPSALAIRKQQAEAEKLSQFDCWRVGKPHAHIYLCQPQALLTIFNESPLLLLLPSAMTFTIQKHMVSHKRQPTTYKLEKDSITAQTTISITKTKRLILAEETLIYIHGTNSLPYLKFTAPCWLLFFFLKRRPGSLAHNTFDKLLLTRSVINDG